MKIIDRIKNFWERLGNPDIAGDGDLTPEEMEELKRIEGTGKKGLFIPKANIDAEKARGKARNNKVIDPKVR